MGFSFVSPNLVQGGVGGSVSAVAAGTGAQDAMEGSSRGARPRRQSPRRPAGRVSAGEVGRFRVPSAESF